jgi:hypothetical protein
MSRVQQAIETTPTWANWLMIAGTALLAWIQPIAGIVAIVWGCIQIYSWVRSEWRSYQAKKGS